MLDKESRGAGASLLDRAAPASPAAGKQTLTERDARGGDGEGEVDDRGTGALIGGAIGAVGGAIIGGLVGGLPGAVGGAVMGGAAGAGAGALMGGADAGPAAPAAVPTPIAVRNGPTHTPIDSGDSIGMAIAITVTSSSGNDADMARIQDSEQVGTSINHTGCATTMAPMPSRNSGFMAGHPIPADRHGSSRARIVALADAGGSGSYEREQLDIYTDAAAGVTTPVAIPSSGYIVKRIITKGAGTNVTFRTEKRPAAVTVNGFTTAAGPSATQGDTVVARA